MSISELQYHYQLDFTVRDYELDMEGLVNNAQYLNYLEHTRHEFLKTINIDFAALVESGLKLIAKAKIIGACINQKGRPVFPKEWNDIFDHLNFIPN
jgi:acyl-CoA thioesterase FadM